LQTAGNWFINRSLFDPRKTFQLRGPLRRLPDTARWGARAWVFAAVALGGNIVAFLLPPLRQPESYHQFADVRTLAGIPNCLNVVSNAGFLVVGVLGLWYLAGSDRFIEPRERTAYMVFFLGVCGTSFGSAYYHWAPRNGTLAWDRLPMTLAFMSLLSAMIAERISATAGTRLLWPLVALGAASVAWWRWTENLWPYMAAQYFTIFLIGWLVLLFSPSYTRGGDLLVVTGLYALAKVAERLDKWIFSLKGWISGHTLKHLIATAAVYWLLRMLRKRASRGSMSHLAFSPHSRLTNH
jgi:hypothetical protein